MNAQKYLNILSVAAQLKTTPRHCWTEKDRRESVADHCWRTALMAMLLSGEAAFRDVDLDKVIRMCLIHDLGESFTGDIPCFEKTEAESVTEETLLDRWVSDFPEPTRTEWRELLQEMEEQKTDESKVYKALDKLEALISHNESDIATWLPNEYDLQLTYGKANMECSSWFGELREAVDDWTLKKIGENGRKPEEGAL